FVGELLRHLADTGAILQDQAGQWTASTKLREHGLPVSVREVLGQRVDALGDEVARVLTMAAVSGREFELDVVARALNLEEDPVLDVMDAAVAATLVINQSGRHYRFVHALIEHSLYDRLTPARRTRAHRQIAEAIEGLYRANIEPRVGELAYHWV